MCRDSEGKRLGIRILKMSEVNLDTYEELLILIVVFCGKEKTLMSSIFKPEDFSESPDD